MRNWGVSSRPRFLSVPRSPKGSTITDDRTKSLMTIQEGALAAGEKSGNLGMYLGLGVKDDIVEPENEICE